MPFEITIHLEKNEKLNAVLTDLIASAAFFGRKEIDIQKFEDGVAFIFQGHCPNDYFFYLNGRYDASFDYINEWILKQRREGEKN